MVFKCQEDSFLKEFTSKVLKCDETKESIIDYGKIIKFEGYQIVLENTILFPAGGGQPHDIGWLDNIEVLQVLRKGDEAIHFTKEPLPIGTMVTQKILWERRFDHMQQHSGQHLLSAILEKYALPTTSWWLGADESYVELDATSVGEDVIKNVETRCNELIRDAVPVNVKFCKASDPDLNEAHTRGLPKDCMDTIRIICIGDIDENMCCGTHVTNLRNEPNKLEELVSKLQKNFKITNKSLQNVLSELAQFEVDRIKNIQPKPKYIFMCKKEATPDFNRAICKALEGDSMFLFLASSELEKPKEGQIIIQGPEEHCNELGQQITAVLKAKGAFKHGKFQGKAGDLSGLNKCKKLIEEYFTNVS